MAASSSSKDKFFENVINPYLREVMQHPQAIEMREGVLHIRDVQGPKGKGTVDARLEAMEQEIDYLKRKNSILNHKLRRRDKIAKTTPPPSSSSPKET